jgi:hypothetical protein
MGLDSATSPSVQEKLQIVGNTGRHREPVVVVVTSTGAAVPVPVSQLRRSSNVSPLGVLELLKLAVLDLIRGSRGEPGGRRR